MRDANQSEATGHLLALTQLAPFQILPAAELRLLALAGREQVIPRRTVLVEAGELPGALYVPLRGQLELSTPAPQRTPEWNPARLAGLALLGQSELVGDLVASAGAELLVVDRDALLTVLEEHGTLCRHLLRALALQLRTVRPIGGPTFRAIPGPAPKSTDLVSRMIVFRKLLGPGGGGMAAVARLARVARDLRLAIGMPLEPSTRSADLLVITHGSLRLVPLEGSARFARAGEVVGLPQAVAGLPLLLQAIATTPVSALVISGPELAQAIEDEDLLCLDLIRGFAAELLAESTAQVFERATPEHIERTN
jgi:CRP-like cAMP-binding protein